MMMLCKETLTFVCSTILDKVFNNIRKNTFFISVQPSKSREKYLIVIFNPSYIIFAKSKNVNVIDETVDICKLYNNRYSI